MRLAKPKKKGLIHVLFSRVLIIGLLILLQVLIAGLVGGVSLFWTRIKRLFGFGKKDDAPKPPQDAP